jgi:hypothetical protein
MQLANALIRNRCRESPYLDMLGALWWSFLMSCYERRIAVARLSDSLLDQMLELERLRQQVRKAELFANRSGRRNPKKGPARNRKTVRT